MVLPFIAAAYFGLDMVIMLGTGKDILEHLTGWDPVGDAIDWAFDKMGWNDGVDEVAEELEVDLSPITEAIDGLASFMSDWFLLILLAIGFVAALVLLKRR